MSSTWTWKMLVTLAGALLAIYLLVPSFLAVRDRVQNGDEEIISISPVRKILPKKIINLGLDLRGGMYVELDVDLASAIKNRIDILLSEIERLATKEDFPGLKMARSEPLGRVTLELPADKRSPFLAWLKENFGDVFESAGVVSSEMGEGRRPEPVERRLVLKMTEEYSNHIRSMTVRQAEEAVRNRIDRYGVAEASIHGEGDDRIIVELPGVKDPERVIEVIRKTGLLEFKMVDESTDFSILSKLVSEARGETGLAEGYSKEVVEKLNTALKGKIPEDAEVLFQLERDPVTKEIVNGLPHLLKQRAEVTGDMLRNAQVGVQNNEPYVGLSFNRIGTKNFGELTKNNVGKKLAIVLDDVVSTAPVIESAILNGEAQITLGFGTYQSLLREAEDLALLLREGALPAALTVATKTVIGPSLGQDSIKSGLMALLIAAAAIVLFMLLYYKIGGALASFCLFLNVLFIFAILALFQASLTLPGMAGIILTMGMAVDANIIIFERMKEEIRLGKTARAVVESGYGNAMSAIIDANITTLIAGIVLYQFGTGPIKGFATTLMIGIGTTLFTAIVVSRLVYDYLVQRRGVGRLIL